MTPEHKAHKVQQALTRLSPAPKVTLAPKVLKERKVRPVLIQLLPDLKALKEMSVHKDHRGTRERHQLFPAHRVTPDLKARRVTQAPKALKGIQVPKVLKAPRVIRDPKVTSDLKALKATQARKVKSVQG